MAPLPSWHACGSGVSNSAQWMSSGVGHSLGTGSGHILLLLELLCPWSVPEPLGWYTGMTEGSPTALGRHPLSTCSLNLPKGLEFSEWRPETMG